MEINKIKNICKELGIVPIKSKGQNFLINKDVVGDIIQAADLSQADTVLEIGSGLGVLTEELVKKVKQVVAVELDRKLFSYLKDKFGKVENLKLAQGDILTLLHCYIATLLPRGYKVVANLPYQITSRVLRLLLGAANPPIETVLMVQKEVGERICAKAGKMSILSVMVQYYAQPKIVQAVGKENFWPRPQVDSVILKIKNQESRIKNQDKEELFFKIVKIGFLNRRKMLKNNLAAVYDSQLVEKVLGEMGLDLKVRAQELSVEEWINLTEKIYRANDKKL